jgi:transcription elongation GreA/GreB family factor
MNKKTLIEQMQSHLLEELREIQGEVLAGKAKEGSGERVHEIERLLTMYRFLPVREFDENDVACPAALVELKLEPKGTRAWYFIAPQGGGLITSVDGEPVQVVTPQSLMGDALLGKRVGDQFELEVRGSVRSYRLLAIR